MLPKKIAIENKSILKIVWDDESESKIKLTNLRQWCPCAVCITERENRSSSYIPIFTSDQLKPTDLRVVGNYAIGISWKDGHNLGIYEFNMLRELEQVDSA